MDFIRPPTDNLYKFTAIAGVAILLVSTVIPVIRVWQLDLRLTRLGARLDYDELQLLRRAPGIEQAHQIAEKLQSAGDTVDEETRALWNRQYDSITENWPDLEAEEMRQIEQKGRQRSIAIAETKALTRQMETIWSMAVVGSGVGLGVAALGFWLWWIRVQKFQDKILRRRAETESEQE